jgi:hypothetical protein
MDAAKYDVFSLALAAAVQERRGSLALVQLFVAEKSAWLSPDEPSSAWV